MASSLPMQTVEQIIYEEMGERVFTKDERMAFAEFCAGWIGPWTHGPSCGCGTSAAHPGGHVEYDENDVRRILRNYLNQNGIK